jgi:bile acid-coenzyme A ligase
VDLIISGDTNIYPAEVESVLHQHPAVAEAVVVGLPDEDWGQRVHAIVQLRPEATATGTAADLNRHCRVHLSAYKCPKTYEFLASLPRDDIGKVRRSALAQERAGAAATSPGTPPAPPPAPPLRPGATR